MWTKVVGRIASRKWRVGLAAPLTNRNYERISALPQRDGFKVRGSPILRLSRLSEKSGQFYTSSVFRCVECLGHGWRAVGSLSS